MFIYTGGPELYKKITKHLNRDLLGYIYDYLDVDQFGLMKFIPNPRMVGDDITLPYQVDALMSLACEEESERAIEQVSKRKRLCKADGH